MSTLKNHSVNGASSERNVLIINNEVTKKKVLTSIKHKLTECTGFQMSVAFITTSGVACIKEQLKELEGQGVKGKILTSTYLNFTQPLALLDLLKFSNIEVRIETERPFHSKGYLFEGQGGQYDLILGSSNLTQTALTTNIELNVRMRDLTLQDPILQEYNTEFEAQWAAATPVDLAFIKQYEQVYQSKKNDFNSLAVEEGRLAYGNTFKVPVPNKMQREALDALEEMRKKGEQKALIISATGTGKTFLSAFDVKRVEPRRMLFLVHRRTIAQKSMESYQLIIDNRTMALYSGAGRMDDADFLFGTVLSVTNDLQKFAPDAFDYIVIDESHRAEATTYKRIMDHFKPLFLLGMTATPERSDGTHVFELFDHNIAYEIRLNQALNEGMLVPFHYFGVTDFALDGIPIEEQKKYDKLPKDERLKYLLKLTSEERITHILKQAAFYGAYDVPVKGLVFVSQKEEAHQMAQKFNERGVPAVALTGESSHKQRIAAISQLESGDLRYLITVDIFNEGVDIPEVNQVIMLRPTQSAIVFVQQLGRGLRKTQNKQYLTVIDFIANYKNSYLIPVALYGDTSYNKDNLRKLLVGQSQGLPGSCTIDFDRIAQQQIFDSINSAQLSKLSDLKQEYVALKKMLGRMPMMMDFIRMGRRDPYQFIDYSGSYYAFVHKVDSDSLEHLDDFYAEVLGYLQKFVNDGKRGLEAQILLDCIVHGVYDPSRTQMLPTGHLLPDINAALHVVNLNFDTKNHEKKEKRLSEKLGIQLLEWRDNSVKRTQEFNELLRHQTFHNFLIDSTLYSQHSFTNKIRSGKLCGDFILHEKYSRRDVLRLLNWDKDRNGATIGGYRTSPDGTNCPIFVTYDKHDVDAAINYADEFISASEFQWMSRSKRTKLSKELHPIIHADTLGVRLPFFLKKSDNEGIDFYYLGDVHPLPGSIEDTTMPDETGKLLNVVKFIFQFEHPVPEELLRYFEM